MTAPDLLARLHADGIILLAVSGRLFVRAGAGRLTDELRAEIRAHKAELIALLEVPVHPCTRCGRFAYPKPTVCTWCRKLAAKAAA